MRPDVVKWNRALATFSQAEAKFHAFASRRHAARSSDISLKDWMVMESWYDTYRASFHIAIRRLLCTPACDAAALAVKIAIIVDHEVFARVDSDECLMMLKQDALRLSGA